ncbi:MAG: translation factor Sua5, partial [Bacteroidia bacterium]|nr:translation factor Sua5 [Bacteroidia bacterium]
LIDCATSPLTIIYSGAIGLPTYLIKDDGSIAIRVVKDGFYGELLRKWGKALISTSANKSGSDTPIILSNVSAEILEAVDYTVNLQPTETATFKSSQIIKLDIDGKIKIIRQ